LEFKKTIEEKKGINIEKNFGKILHIKIKNKWKMVKIKWKMSPSGFEPSVCKPHAVVLRVNSHSAQIFIKIPYFYQIIVTSTNKPLHFL
jgi:hypothetical protein